MVCSVFITIMYHLAKAVENSLKFLYFDFITCTTETGGLYYIFQFWKTYNFLSLILFQAIKNHALAILRRTKPEYSSLFGGICPFTVFCKAFLSHYCLKTLNTGLGVTAIGYSNLLGPVDGNPHKAAWFYYLWCALCFFVSFPFWISHPFIKKTEQNSI